jgi:hypothetical protein
MKTDLDLMTGDASRPIIHPKIGQYRGVSKTTCFLTEAAKYQEGRWSVDQPTTCVRCHGADFHYIWHGYPYWPHTYGADDDQISIGSDTEKMYQSFLQRKNSSRRYGTLLFGKSELYPYSSSFKYKDTKLRPNLTFSAKLIRLNGQRILRKLKESPKFNTLKFKILYMLSECDAMPRPSSDKLWDKILSNEKAELQAKELKLSDTIAEHKIYTHDAHSFLFLKIPCMTWRT